MDNAKQITTYLDELAQTLVDMGIKAQYHIIVTGGAYMLLQSHRRSTEDIDFALIASPPGRVKRNQTFTTTVQKTEIARRGSAVPFAQEFKQAIEVVAQQHGLPQDWLNDELAVYLYDDAPQAEVFFWRSFAKVLSIYLPTAEYMLALKIAAWRPKDENDIQVLLSDLGIQTRDQVKAIIDAFLLPAAQTFWEVDDHLDALFPD